MNAPTAVAEQMTLVDSEQRPSALPSVQQQNMPANVVTPADLLRIAMESGDKDIERLERLMAMDERYRQMQERERQRAAELAFRRDFAALAGENITVPKTKHVDRGRGGSFEQAEYHVVSDMLKPALSRHGFGFRHDQKFGARRWMTDGVESDVPWVWVTCYLEHRDGHSEKLELEGPPGDLSVNTPTQNMQSTASYLKRQSLLAITGTATGGEDDENRLRPRGNPQQTDAAPEANESLLDAGRDAAMNGMKALTAWWGALTAKQRSTLNNEFGSLRKAAAAADREAGRG